MERVPLIKQTLVSKFRESQDYRFVVVVIYLTVNNYHITDDGSIHRISKIGEYRILFGTRKDCNKNLGDLSHGNLARSFMFTVVSTWKRGILEISDDKYSFEDQKLLVTRVNFQFEFLRDFLQRLTSKYKITYNLYYGRLTTVTSFSIDIFPKGSYEWLSTKFSISF